MFDTSVMPVIEQRKNVFLTKKNTEKNLNARKTPYNTAIEINKFFRFQNPNEIF